MREAKKIIIPVTLAFLMVVSWPASIRAADPADSSMQTAVSQASDSSDLVRTTKRPPTEARNSFYASNRPPLKTSPLVKLPIGNIQPKGWLKRMLKLEAEGMVGHMEELSHWCNPENSAWMSPEGKGTDPWEELPYWLKGYGDMGYVLDDQKIIGNTKEWIDAVIAGQQEDGWFGPVANKTRANGKPDLWPNMIMLNVLQSYYEYTGDARVLDLMRGYFKWELSVPDEDFLPPFWQQQRAGDNLESVYWLYNRTGEEWLLKLADKIHRNMAPWHKEVASWHGVNITQCFRAPAIYWMQSKNRDHLQATRQNYKKVMDLYGQQPGGMFGADENCREGYHGPRQAAETCSMVEFMHSFEMLTKITGNTRWADRCEEVAFNSLPAATMDNLKGLHYLTAPNMVQLDRKNKSPGIQNGGCMLAYSPHRYRCCQHNHAHGWPYFAEELWLATSDDGLCASPYSASEVTAKVGDGTEVTVTEDTDYPFDDTVRLTLEAPKSVNFPLYLRVPKWCDGAKLEVNDKDVETSAEGGEYLVVEREWDSGDTVELQFPMEFRVTKWDRDYENARTEPNGSLSVSRGPLTYSLRIGQRWEQFSGSDEWPAYEVYPASDWNYGLLVNMDDPAESFEVIEQKDRLPEQPWSLAGAPIEVRAKGKQIPEWQKNALGLVGKMQPNPVKSDQPTETLTLIPMGCARLRISAFPQIGSGPEAHEWKAKPQTQFSHCFGGDTPAALDDGRLPENSNDHSIPRFTWWNHKGSTEWVQYNFPKPRKLSWSDVYWFDDTGKGECRVPASWRLLVKQDGKWKPVKGVKSYETKKDRFNKVEFEPVTTESVRLEVKLKPDYSGGILEWRVGDDKQ